MKTFAIVVTVGLVLGGGILGLMLAGVVPGLGSPAKSKSAKAKAAESPVVAISQPRQTEVDDAPARPKTRPVQPATQLTPQAKAEADRKLARLASVYEAMPAEQALPIVAKLPDPLVHDLFQRMDERQVGKLLALMPPERAALLTRELAK